MQQDLGAELFQEQAVSRCSSASLSLWPGISSVVTSSQQSVSLWMYSRRIQHRLQVTAGQLVVEVLGEGLQVDIGRIHVGEELAPWLVADIACSDRDGFQPLFMTGRGGVERVFEKITGSL